MNAIFPAELGTLDRFRLNFSQYDEFLFVTFPVRLTEIV